MSQMPSLQEVNAFFREAFDGSEERPQIIELGEGTATARLVAGTRHLRPGNFVSGPTQMSMADTVTYVAIFTRIGITPMTVTTSLNMSFLRPLIAEVVVARAQLLKMGRTLAVAEVDIRGEGHASASSHAVVTYAIPRDEGA